MYARGESGVQFSLKMLDLFHFGEVKFGSYIFMSKRRSCVSRVTSCDLQKVAYSLSGKQLISSPISRSD